MDAPRPDRMSAPGKTEPTEAIARARTGDADAWGVLYREYASAIFRFCRRVLPTREDAEDATMDIFAKLMRDNRRLQYDQNRSFTAWLTRSRLTIAGTCCGGARHARIKRPTIWRTCRWSTPI